jgi:positive regulator of sigma E activity
LSRSLCAPVKTIDIENTSNAKVGELVLVQIDEAALRGFTTRVYVFPVLAILLGAGLGQLLVENGSVGSVLGALAGFGFALVAGAVFRSEDPQRPKLVPLADVMSIDQD